jgi:hypothetical protein
MPITKKQAEKEVNFALAQFDMRIQAIANRVREERVISACRRIGGSFSSGMGTFGFYDHSGSPIMEWEAGPFRLESVLEVLNLEITHGRYLGDWVLDVPRVDR